MLMALSITRMLKSISVFSAIDDDEEEKKISMCDYRCNEDGHLTHGDLNEFPTPRLGMQ